MISTGIGTAKAAPVRIRYLWRILIASLQTLTIFMISTGTAKPSPVRIR